MSAGCSILASRASKFSGLSTDLHAARSIGVHRCASVVALSSAVSLMEWRRKAMEPPMHTDAHRWSERIIGCAFRMMNTLGSGFLEKVYENALAHELRKAGLQVSQQHAIVVRYDDVIVGEYA